MKLYDYDARKIKEDVVEYKICLYCSLIIQSPRFSNEYLEYFYSTQEYRNTLIDEAQTTETMDYSEKIEAQRYLSYINSEPKSILDVGCSRGYFLQAIKSKFPDCKTYGVEPHIDYLDYKPDYLFAKLAEVEETFDLVTCFHVLEHVAYPKEFVSLLIKKLANKGRLLIEVPNNASKGGPLRRAHNYLIQPWVLVNWLNPLSDINIELTPHTFVSGKNRIK